MKTLPLIHFVNFFVQIVQIVDTFLCILHYFMREKVYHTINTLIHISTQLSTMTSFLSISSLLSTFSFLNPDDQFPFSFFVFNIQFPIPIPICQPSFPFLHFPQSLYFQQFYNFSLYLCILSLSLVSCLSCLAAVTVLYRLLSLRCIIVLFI